LINTNSNPDASHNRAVTIAPSSRNNCADGGTIRIFTLILCLLAAPLSAQDRQGRNNLGDWRETDNVKTKRCYLRYVDVFSEKPKFAALFTFITPEANGYRIAFGFENGVAYKQNGLRIDADGNTSWSLADINCTRQGECLFTGSDAQSLITALDNPNATLTNEFFDPYGREQNLSWDLSRFPAALADFNREVAARALR
jgi:hypothetical protein